MHISAWLRFLAAGDPPIVSVARLSPELCLALGCSSNLVRLRYDYVIKCFGKHKLEPQHFALLEVVFAQGRAVLDREGSLTFFYFDAFLNCWLKAGIKSNAEGTELWLSTFHRANRKQVEKRSDKGKILRE